MLPRKLILQSVRDGCFYVQLALGELVSAEDRLLVAVAGKTKAGKTHFVREMVQYLTGLGVTSACLAGDRYFFDIDDAEIPKDQLGYPVFDHPDSYHHDELSADIYQLLRGESVHMPEYSLEENKRVRRDGTLVAPGRVILVDYLFAIDLVERIETPHRLKLFLDARQSIRLQRRLVCDAQFCDKPERIERYFFGCVELFQAEYVEPQRRFSDIVLMSEGG